MCFKISVIRLKFKYDRTLQSLKTKNIILLRGNSGLELKKENHMYQFSFILFILLIFSLFECIKNIYIKGNLESLKTTNVTDF